MRDDLLADVRPGESLPHMFPTDLQNPALSCKCGETEEGRDRNMKNPFYRRSEALRADVRCLQGCARGGTRTLTSSRTTDFELASAALIRRSKRSEGDFSLLSPSCGSKSYYHRLSLPSASPCSSRLSYLPVAVIATPPTFSRYVFCRFPILARSRRTCRLLASERNRSAGAWVLISLLFSPRIGLLPLIAAGDATPESSGGTQSSRRKQREEWREKME